MGFPRQEYWSGLPYPSPGDLSDSGIKPASPALASRFFTAEPPGKYLIIFYKTTLFLCFHFFFACLQGRNREAHMKKGLVDTGWEGESAMNWESRLDIRTLPCIKQIASRKLLYSIESPAWCSAMS